MSSKGGAYEGHIGCLDRGQDGVDGSGNDSKSLLGPFAP